MGGKCEYPGRVKGGTGKGFRKELLVLSEKAKRRKGGLVIQHVRKYTLGGEIKFQITLIHTLIQSTGDLLKTKSLLGVRI